MPILNTLEKTINYLAKSGYQIGKLRAIYAEHYVASRLATLFPQLGEDRCVKSADIYLAAINKRVEVKATQKGSFCLEGADWCWAINPEQLKKRKFDYCVMIGFDDKEPLKIVKELVFSYNDFGGEPSEREDFMHESAGLCYYSEGYSGSLTRLERKLREHPNSYEARYDRIE